MPARITLKVQKNGYLYLQRRVPADIMRTASADVRKDVLGTASEIVKVYLGKDEKDAKRRMSVEWSRLEDLFDNLRGKPVPSASKPVTEELLAAIAWSIYNGTLDDLKQFVSARPDLKRSGIRHGFEMTREKWVEGLRDDIWAPATTVITAGELSDRGVSIPETSPEFQDARRRIAHAILEAHEKMDHRLDGDDSYEPNVRRQAAPTATKHDDQLSLSALFELWKDETKPADKTSVEFERAVRRFTELHGETPAIAITKAMVRGFKTALSKLPANLFGEELTMKLPALLEAERWVRMIGEGHHWPSSPEGYATELLSKRR